MRCWKVWGIFAGVALVVFVNAASAVAQTFDNAGNGWVPNSGDSVTEFLGATDPVVTPTAVAAGAGAVGAKS